jgi:glutamate racemase
MTENGGAIGIFDSGVGGLTVFRQVAARLPRESILYLGDTARVPYGTKSPETVLRYARGCADLLMERGVKLIVVACNTASACAVPFLRDHLSVPVLGVIEPGARAAAAKTNNQRIGVIGTRSTIDSGAYEAALKQTASTAAVFSAACPLFVPLAEEGWLQGEVPERTAQHYLPPLLENNIDTLILGCTHYPLLKRVIGQAAGNAVTLVDSAEETAMAVANALEASKLTARPGDEARHQFLVSDSPKSFARIGQHFLGMELHDVEWVDV